MAEILYNVGIYPEKIRGNYMKTIHSSIIYENPLPQLRSRQL